VGLEALAGAPWSARLLVAVVLVALVGLVLVLVVLVVVLVVLAVLAGGLRLRRCEQW
jgi:hypothetical protein